MYLYGASGHARVIIDIVRAMGLSVERLFDDNPAVNSLEDIAVAHNYGGESPLIISIGNNAIRKRLAENMAETSFATAIHPTAVLSPTASVGEGTVVMPGAIINSRACVGRHCIVNTGAAIDHECRLGDYVHISPHATLCGNVTVGEGAWVGAGATVIPGISIGRWAVVGAGSVVVSDIPDGAVAYGNPCRVRRTTKQTTV